MVGFDWISLNGSKNSHCLSPAGTSNNTAIDAIWFVPFLFKG